MDLIYGAGKVDRRVADVEDLMRQRRVREADLGQLYLDFKPAKPVDDARWCSVMRLRGFGGR